MRCLLATILLTAVFVMDPVMQGHSLGAEDRIVRPDLAAFFTRQGTSGTFVLFDLQRNRLTLVNPERAEKRKIPASTFKIANSLIALDTGNIKNEDEIIPYGGKPQPIARWEKDMSMRDAIKVSNLPVYQELARRVGLEQYAKWLKILNYGNRKTGKDVETFWLRGPLKISAVEQVRFLADLAMKRLPVSNRSQSIVTEIIRLESRSGRTLYAKTGWTTAPTPDIGWFVGWVANGSNLHAFALNMDMSSRADARNRASIAKELLQELGVF